MMSFSLVFSLFPPRNMAIMHQSSCNHEDVTAFEAGQREREQDGSLMALWCHLLQLFHLETNMFCEKNKFLFGSVSVVRFSFHGIQERGENNNSRGRNGKKRKKKWTKYQHSRKLFSHTPNSYTFS